ncbi:MAG: hypothetical protein OEW37_03145 [Rhodospirillaceae bacterium]|nr:hypothetical protein [Rhodospirillaceae bacterium]
MTSAAKEVYLGEKFNSNHQLALILSRHMGKKKACATAKKNGWEGVLQALSEQMAIVTIPH